MDSDHCCNVYCAGERHCDLIARKWPGPAADLVGQLVSVDGGDTFMSIVDAEEAKEAEPPDAYPHTYLVWWYGRNVGSDG